MTLVAMQSAGLPFAYLDPSQGRLSWAGGFVLGSKTKEWHHAHAYVESYINHDACAQMTNLFYYGNANDAVQPTEIKNQTLAKALKLADPRAIAAPDVHLQSWSPSRAQLELLWQEVQAA